MTWDLEGSSVWKDNNPLKTREPWRWSYTALLFWETSAPPWGKPGTPGPQWSWEMGGTFDIPGVPWSCSGGCWAGKKRCNSCSVLWAFLTTHPALQSGRHPDWGLCQLCLMGHLWGWGRHLKKKKYWIQPVSSPGRQGLNTEEELDPQSLRRAGADALEGFCLHRSGRIRGTQGGAPHVLPLHFWCCWLDYSAA